MYFFLSVILYMHALCFLCDTLCASIHVYVCMFFSWFSSIFSFVIITCVSNYGHVFFFDRLLFFALVFCPNKHLFPHLQLLVAWCSLYISAHMSWILDIYTWLQWYFSIFALHVFKSAFSHKLMSPYLYSFISSSFVYLFFFFFFSDLLFLCGSFSYWQFIFVVSFLRSSFSRLFYSSIFLRHNYCGCFSLPYFSFLLSSTISFNVSSFLSFSFFFILSFCVIFFL